MVTTTTDDTFKLVEKSIQQHNEEIGLKGTWTVLENRFILNSDKLSFPVYAVLNNDTAEVRFFSARLLEILELGESAE